MLCLGVRASATGAYGRIHPVGFVMAEPPTVIALFGGRRRVASLNDIAATKDRNSGEVCQGLPVFSADLHHDREGFLVAEAGVSIRVEEMSLRNEDRLGVEDRWLKAVTQNGIVPGMGLDWESVDGEL